MNDKTKLILALTQVESIVKLLEGNQWQSFFNYHLINVRSEIKRQLSLQDGKTIY